LLIITAILLAFFVDIVTSSLVILSSENINISFLGLAFLIIAAILFYKFFISKETINIKLRGTIAYEFIDNKIKPIEIYGYEFNENFNASLESLLPKNRKYRQIFNKEKNNNENVEKNYKYNPDDITNKKNIINSILEYLILEKLSIHLDDYYNTHEIDEEKIITITISNLENRIFSENNVLKNIIKEEFEINLPINSKITRNTNNYLEINNKIFDIIIIPDYKGFNEYTNPIITDYNAEKEQYPFYLIEIKLSIILKRDILFNDDYGWLDSFLDEIYEFVSIEHLNKKLNPDLLNCLLKIIK
ncbi:MAG: hypothetical protein ACRCVG_07460, partial [Methanobacteriaceae archaeon]